ncbi:MAG TPA: hypothetical protein VHF22_08225, partial [Planctomycetota bacterium]|nr:hypothetical protein [Planctomycetota bacterium]
GIAYLRRFAPPHSERDFYFYGHYYAAQVMFLRGGRDGDAWLDAVLDELGKKQRSDGSWRHGETTLAADDDTLISTAWAVQVAEIRKGCLPLFAD